VQLNKGADKALLQQSLDTDIIIA